jgi:hypothetical protein
MELIIENVDYAPEELYGQVPIRIELLRELPGPDRPDYWLGKVNTPIKWIENNIEKHITHIVVAARWVGTQIKPGVRNLPVGISYVTDVSLLEDSELDFKKCYYCAIGMSHDAIHNMSHKNKGVLTVILEKLFGKGL